MTFMRNINVVNEIKLKQKQEIKKKLLFKNEVHNFSKIMNKNTCNHKNSSKIWMQYKSLLTITGKMKFLKMYFIK